MGLIHSRAAKKRNKAEAELLKEQTREMKQDRRAAQAGGAEVIAAMREKRAEDTAARAAVPARTVDEIRAAGKAQREEIRVAAAERREERLTRQEEDRPDAWYKEPTLGGLLSRRKAAKQDKNRLAP